MSCYAILKYEINNKQLYMVHLWILINTYVQIKYYIPQKVTQYSFYFSFIETVFHLD